ncbi:MAG: TetR/AcrR family transcriptional regulator [Ginsengibacter sp.]
MRKEILQTSLDQFLKFGIRKMSVRKLVEPLGISTKTVYNHFKNKEDLLKNALHLYYDQKYQSFRCDASEQNVVPLLCDIWYKSLESDLQVNQIFFRDLLHYYPELNERFTARTHKMFTELFLKILSQGIDEGLLKKDIVPQVVLDGMFVLYTAIMRQEEFKKFHVDSLDLLINTMLIYVRGLCTEKGRKEFNVQTYWPIGKSRKSNVKAAADRISLN